MLRQMASVHLQRAEEAQIEHKSRRCLEENIRKKTFWYNDTCYYQYDNSTFIRI